MKGYLLVAVAVTAVALTGCATTEMWSATGGSRADATVRLSYTYGAFQVPHTSEQQALSLAVSRCDAWGYKGAEAFGGVERRCSVSSGLGGCSQFEVTKEYQCMGTGRPSALHN